ncbi:MAG TPA: hypothetical protein VD995_31195 [Azospirillum sp.]|nr:hypothetical protein [Azospirillum sp.]
MPHPGHPGAWVPLHYCNDLDGVFVDGGAGLTAAFYLDAFDRYRSRLARAR